MLFILHVCNVPSLVQRFPENLFYLLNFTSSFLPMSSYSCRYIFLSIFFFVVYRSCLLFLLFFSFSRLSGICHLGWLSGSANRSQFGRNRPRPLNFFLPNSETSSVSSFRSRRRAKSTVHSLPAGLPDFSGCNLPKMGELYQIANKLPNGHILYQMAIKYSKWQ
jgi:hypothetical protein